MQVMTDCKVGLTKGFDGGLNIGAFYTDTNKYANAAANGLITVKISVKQQAQSLLQKTF
jgi:hypothetical protein